MAENDVSITYETLFDLLRREKARDELQELDKNFFEDLSKYIDEKKKIFIEQKSKLDLFSSTEKEKTEKQLENIRKILKDIYEKREIKIINLAISKSRVPGIIVDTAVFLEEEKKFFDQLIEILDNYRIGILFRILEGEPPLLKEEKAGAASDHKDDYKEQNIGEKEETKSESSNKVVRFKNAVPRFVGAELEEYGPFEQDEIANLPPEIASVLVEKDRAEFIG